MTKMPTWVADRLIRDGTMTGDRVTKHARPRRCKTCGLFTLVGLDDLTRRITVDPAPTTTTGEAFALLSGRASFGIVGDQLFERTASRLTYRRADDHPVHISHECHSLSLPVNKQFLPRSFNTQEGEPPF